MYLLCCKDVKFLSLRKVHGWKVYENRMLRIYVPKREELTIGWKKLHNQELLNLCCWASRARVVKTRKIIWAGHV
jgi:hypothetical protein